jgi:hypothetical protein
MRSRRQRILGLMGGGHGPSDGDLPELQATSNAYSDCQHRQPRLRPSDRARSLRKSPSTAAEADHVLYKYANTLLAIMSGALEAIHEVLFAVYLLTTALVV